MPLIKTKKSKPSFIIGATMVEVALGLAFFLLFILLAINFILIHMQWISLQRAVSEAHRALSINEARTKVIAKNLVIAKAAKYGITVNDADISVCIIDIATANSLATVLSGCTPENAGFPNDFTGLFASIPATLFIKLPSMRIKASSVKRNERSFN